MDQNKVTICWPNRVDQAALSGGSWSSSLPLSNLQDRVFAKKARTTSTSAAHTKCTVALDKSRAVAAIALAAHNLTAVATVRVRAYDDYAQTTLLYDSGAVLAWPGFYQLESYEWEDNSFWFGDQTLDVASDYTPLATIFFPDIVIARSLLIEIADALNPAGYVEAGRLMVANAWQPEINMSYGVQFSYINTTGVEETDDGTEYFDRRSQRRTMDFALENMTQSEAFGSIYAMKRDLGIDREVLLAYELEPSTEFFYRTFIGRLAQVDPISHPYLSRYSSPISIREII